MPDNTAPIHPTFPVVLDATSTTELAIVPVQQPLSPQEIERMCKAFIRLITAEEKPTNDHNRPTRAGHRKNSHLHQEAAQPGADEPPANL